MTTQSSHQSDVSHAALAAAAAPRFALALASKGKAPDWVMLLPAGRIDTNDGRWFDNNRPDAVVEAYASGGLQLPFDFEHGSELVATRGEFAPAAGWIVELANRDGEIWAKVEWTDRGRAAIEAKEVKYISPAFTHSWDTYEIHAVTSAALTVRPAITALPSLNSQQTNKESMMDKKALCAALGLAETASDADILAAIAATKAKALASQQPDLTAYVPRADYDQVMTRATTAETALASRDSDTLKREATELVDKGIADGKIAPASKDYYISICASRAGLDQTKAFLSSAPQIVKTKVEPAADQKPAGAALTSQQKKVADSLGLTTDEYKAQLEADAKEAE